ncbi:hypothetical protein R5O87_10835 [Arthrobacter globiformis]|uniref:hypothetical protein n=1 Tax=Arthrobacter globiformis TaxID=1665 RepID=UPI00397DC6FA
MAGLTATGRLSGAERGTLHVIVWVALTAAVVAWCLAGVQIYGIWVGDPVLSVSLLNSFFPEIGEDNPGVLAGQYETASLTVSYLPLPARLMLTCAALLRHLPVVAVCLLMALLCRQQLRYRPLAKFGMHAVAGAGVALSLAGVLPGILEAVATVTSAQELGLPGPEQSDVRETLTIPFLPVDWPVLAMGIFLIVVAGALQMGAIQLGALTAGPFRSGLPGADLPPSGGYPAPAGYPPNHLPSQSFPTAGDRPPSDIQPPR